MRSKISLLVGFVIVAGGGYLVWRLATGYDVGLPDDPSAPTVTLREVDREVMLTDDVRHSIPLSEIVSGGPPKDGIPSIDDPKFVSVAEARDFLEDDEPGIVLMFDGATRFYPYQILVWHEVVNDMINGKRILVTYCPLCATGIVFDPVVDGERVEFGTSGRLWQSNLLMYDRKTDSLWSQVLGEAVVGEVTGATLAVIPSDIARFGTFAKAYPGGEVLSRDTGALRVYGSDPYGSYYTNNSAIYFPLRNQDDRLPTKALVLGVVIDGQAKAYAADAIKEAGEVDDEFQNKMIIARWDTALDAAQLFERLASGEEIRLEGVIPGFWFSWVAAHPDTALWPES